MIALLAYWNFVKSLSVRKSHKKRNNTSSAMKVNFIATLKFEGHKVGYVFKKGNLGLGYYVD